MKKRTTKRSYLEREYSKICKEVDDLYRDKKGQIICFFSNTPVNNPDHHHLIGRENDLLIQKKYIVPVHHKIHMSYHEVSMKKNIMQKWYLVFMKNLFNLDQQVFFKELLKLNKAKILSDSNLLKIQDLKTFLTWIEKINTNYLN